MILFVEWVSSTVVVLPSGMRMEDGQDDEYEHKAAVMDVRLGIDETRWRINRIAAPYDTSQRSIGKDLWQLRYLYDRVIEY